MKIDKRFIQANAKRAPHDFAVNDNIYDPNLQATFKLDNAWQGTFPIVKVHTNGTVTFARANGIHDQYNILHIKPA